MYKSTKVQDITSQKLLKNTMLPSPPSIPLPSSKLFLFLFSFIMSPSSPK